MRRLDVLILGSCLLSLVLAAPTPKPIKNDVHAPHTGDVVATVDENDWVVYPGKKRGAGLPRRPVIIVSPGGNQETN
jgi:hypothetical protein